MEILFIFDFQVNKISMKIVQESDLLDVHNLSRNPFVETFVAVSRCLDDDARDGAVHVLVHQPTGVDAQTTVDVLKSNRHKSNDRTMRAANLPSCNISSRSAPPECAGLY